VPLSGEHWEPLADGEVLAIAAGRVTDSRRVFYRARSS
jgi:hypothetical protein